MIAFSIDQNCHSLWDVVPKCHALAARGWSVHHFVEDIDAAFTAVGADKDSQDLRLARERYYRGGAGDWGAAMFYMPFLAAQPVDIQAWEPYTGLKTATLAKRLGTTVEALYDRFSPGQTLQLVGPSYVGGRDSGCHRVMGDLRVTETADLLRELLAEARRDMLRAFPASACQRRLAEWFDNERARAEALLSRHAQDALVALYGDWLADHVGDSVALGRTSSLFACTPSLVGLDLLETFSRTYDLAASLYNEAIAETDTGLRALHVDRGELPFFATIEQAGHLARTGVFLQGDCLRISDTTVPLPSDGRIPTGKLAAAGVRCLAGKAALLVCQVRARSGGASVALPYHGSPYMPAAHRLAQKLAAHDLLPAALHPVLRVRLRFLDRLGELDVPVRLPEHLAEVFGAREVSTGQLSAEYASAATGAAERLASFRTDEGRQAWQHRALPELAAAISETDGERRKLAARGAPPEQIRPLWKRLKAAQVDLLDRTVQQIARDWQVARIDYCDSRGAIGPWAVALGGRSFYKRVIDNAVVYPEPQQAHEQRR